MSPSLPLRHARLTIGALATATSIALGVACGSSTNPVDDTPIPQPSDAATAPDTQPAPTSTPEASTPTDGSLPGDAGAPSRCGMPPFTWLPGAQMGTVLEQVGRASHTQIELNLAILKARNDNAFKTRRLASNPTKTTLIRYGTQDKGAAADATALVTYPDAAGTFPVMLVLHGTAGFSDACSPTKAIADDQLGGFADELGLLTALIASFGYIVVFPDYLGLKSLGAPSPSMHSYLVGEPTAIASLDAVRATKKLLQGNRAVPGDLVVMGGSQGGHAAAFVSRYQPHYAPELPIKGSVWDVPPSDLVAHTERALSMRVKATDNAVAFFTTSDSWYRQSPNGVASVLAPPFDTRVPADMKSKCSFDTLDNQPLASIFTPAMLAGDGGIGSIPAPWSCYLRENGLPTTSVPKRESTPTLFLLAADDDLVDPGVERASFQKLCAQGQVLEYLECSNATHTKPLTYAFDQWLDFLDARLRGTPMPASTCTVKPKERCTSQP